MHSPETGHDPVLFAETLELLALAPGRVIVDCTTGRGGHATEIARRVGPNGLLIGLDVDLNNLAFAKERTAGLPVRLFHANFSQLPATLEAAGITHVDGILADLGISTNQLFDSRYGLSFGQDMPLDMRLDPSDGPTAADVVNRWPEEKIADLLYESADERFSRRIARKIVEARRVSPIKTTGQLADLVRSAVPPTKPRYGKRTVEIDPATRTFLALRMGVNREIENLYALLAATPKFLKPGGRLAIISFHSTEDRVVKQEFRRLDEAGSMKIITKKPVVPGDAEVEANPRSRSAKLRVAERSGA